MINFKKAKEKKVKVKELTDQELIISRLNILSATVSIMDDKIEDMGKDISWIKSQVKDSIE